MAAKIKAKSKAKPKAKPRPKVNPLDDPAALTRPLTPRLLEEQVQSRTQLYAGPAEQQLKGQVAVHGAMMGAIPKWYEEYVGARANAVQQTKAAYGAALGVQANAAQTAGNVDLQQRSQLNTHMAADAAQRGGQVDPNVAAVGQQAAASRQAMLAGQQGLTAGLGAAQVSYGLNQGVVAAGQGVRSMEQEAGRGRALAVQGGELAAKKGEFATKTRQELIDAEHTKQLENKAFGLNSAKAQADVDNDAANLALKETEAQRKARLDSEKLDISKGQLAVAQQRADTYERSREKQGKPKMSESMRSRSIKTRQDIERARSTIDKLVKTEKPVMVKDDKGKWGPKRDENGKIVRKGKLTWDEIRDRLETGKGVDRVDPDVINVANDIRHKGYISKANVARLHKLGVSVGALGYPTEGGRSRKRKSSSGANLSASQKAKGRKVIQDSYKGL